MKNKAINTLAYTGVVTLSQYIGSKKVKILQTHNSGSSPLFDFLADCLVGDYTTARFRRPNKVMLIQRTKVYDKENAGNFHYEYTYVAGFYCLISKPEKINDGTKSVVRYSFMIPRDAISSNQFEGLCLGLYADTVKGTDEEDIKKYSAFCELNLSSRDIIDSALVVDWELSISNLTSAKVSG
jgi:hypothetical protein